MTKYDSLLIFGPPGSGKGTLAKTIAKGGGHVHFSSGDIFRAIDPSSDDKKLVESFINKGELVPDEVTIDIWSRAIGREVEAGRYFPGEQLMLCDGVPRTLKQAQICDDILNVKGVIVLQADEKVLIERMKGRAVKEGRADDADEAVLHKRMGVYQTQTAEVLSHYPESLLTRVRGDQPPLVVMRDILSGLAELLSSKFRL